MPSRWFFRGLLIGVAALAALACSVDGRAAEGRDPRPLTYVALGASDSVGVGANRPETESWVSVVHSRLPAGSRLLNLGVSGSLLRQAIDQQLPVALESDPDLVTIWLAVNDFNARVPIERYASELDSVLSALRTHTRADIVLGNIPDVTSVPIYQRVPRDELAEEIQRWNRRIAEVAGRRGATVVDLHASWSELASHPEYMAPDGFHPSTEGHRRLADLFHSSMSLESAEQAAPRSSPMR